MGKTVNMTAGPIKKQLIFYALPLILGNLCQQLYNMADSFVVGRFVGQDAFAALGVASTVMNLFIFILSGLNVGASLLMARCWGARDEKGLRNQLWTALWWGGAITAVFTIGGLFFLEDILRLLNTPEVLMRDAQSYLGIIVSGLALTFLYNLFSALFRALGNSKTALGFLIFSTLGNVALDVLFVAVLKMGVAGAAWATVLAQGASVALCYGYCRKSYPFVRIRRADMRLDRRVLRCTAQYGMVAALQQSSLYFGKTLVQGIVNGYGTEVISAYAASTRIESFLLATAASGEDAIGTFISQNTGAGNEKRVRDGFLSGLELLLIYGAAATALLYAFCPWLLGIFLTDARAIELGVAYFRTIGPFYLLAYLCNALVGYFRGTGRMMIPFVGTTLQISLRVLFSALLMPALSLAGVSWAVTIGWLFLATFHLLNYRRVSRAPNTRTPA
ncbi:MAG: MATE family efflux transporter [Clostridia bacterium]